jgi:hypothetical protein
MKRRKSRASVSREHTVGREEYVHIREGRNGRKLNFIKIPHSREVLSYYLDQESRYLTYLHHPHNVLRNNLPRIVSRPRQVCAK